MEVLGCPWTSWDIPSSDIATGFLLCQPSFTLNCDSQVVYISYTRPATPPAAPRCGCTRTRDARPRPDARPSDSPSRRGPQKRPPWYHSRPPRPPRRAVSWRHLNTQRSPASLRWPLDDADGTSHKRRSAESIRPAQRVLGGRLPDAPTNPETTTPEGATEAAPTPAPTHPPCSSPRPALARLLRRSADPRRSPGRGTAAR